jgi:hypothetical protein
MALTGLLKTSGFRKRRGADTRSIARFWTAGIFCSEDRISSVNGHPTLVGNMLEKFGTRPSPRNQAQLLLDYSYFLSNLPNT